MKNQKKKKRNTIPKELYSFFSDKNSTLCYLRALMECSMIAENTSASFNPSARICLGTMLALLIPGLVLISKKFNSPESVIIKSTRQIPKQPTGYQPCAVPLRLTSLAEA